MRYEVIGWTSCTDRRFPSHPPVTACMELAVRGELQRGGYCFGGDMHEEYCPVLSDGTLVDLSWRGWGGLMARARGEDGDFDYMHYYMNVLIDPDLLKYPEEDVDVQRIVPRLTLAEKFVMHLRSDMFDAMAKGKKRVEFRLFDEKRKAIDIGDYIEFIGNDGRLLKRVTDIFIDKNFEKLFDRLTCRSYGSTFTAEDFGSPAGTTATEFGIAMSEIYSQKSQENGVLAFLLEDAVPRFSLSFFAQTKGGYVLLEEEDGTGAAPRILDPDEIEEKLLEIAAFERCACGFCRFAEGTNLVETVGNVLQALFGKEEALLDLANEIGLTFALELTALFPSAPPTSPTLDAAAEEFLRTLNAAVRISTITLP